MQILVDYTVTDQAPWQAEFDARSEARGQAGLTVLQIWRDEDTPNKLICLLQGRDRKRASEWLAVETALHGAGAARFLRTV